MVGERREHFLTDIIRESRVSFLPGVVWDGMGAAQKTTASLPHNLPQHPQEK